MVRIWILICLAALLQSPVFAQAVFSQYLKAYECADELQYSIRTFGDEIRDQRIEFSDSPEDRIEQFLESTLPAIDDAEQEFKERSSDCYDHTVESAIEAFSSIRNARQFTALYLSGDLSEVGLERVFSQLEADLQTILSSAKSNLDTEEWESALNLERIAIQYVQIALLDSGFEVEISGEFDRSSLSALHSFVLALQNDELGWGYGWEGSQDGVYSLDFHHHINVNRLLATSLVNGNNTDSTTIVNFIDAMDYLLSRDALPPPHNWGYREQLLAKHGLTPPDSTEGPAALPLGPSTPSSGNFLAALFFPVVQGFTLEWGDWLFCEYMSDDANCPRSMTNMIEAYQRDFGLIAMIMNFVGIMLSPAGLIFIFAFAGGSKNAGDAFKGGFVAELAEGGIAAGGVIYTHGYLDGVLAFLISTAIAGVLTGAIAASRVNAGS